MLVPLAALIAGSRVVLGLHYPSDVLAGAAIGAALAALGTRLLSMALQLFPERDASALRLIACGYCSFPTSTFRASTASPPPSAPSARIWPTQGVETTLVAPRYGAADARR